MPDFSFETDMASIAGRYIVGVDEVGRGPWSGPVVTAAVWFPDIKHDWIKDLADSKKLSAKKRSILANYIRKDTVWAIAAASNREIDRLNILQASLLAMRRAIARLPFLPDGLLIDGTQDPHYPNVPARLIAKGDDRCCSIAAASILAKTLRDHLMCKLARRYPFYGWEKNSGYGVVQHRAGLENYGVTRHHRLSFRPVRACAQD